MAALARFVPAGLAGAGAAAAGSGARDLRPEARRPDPSTTEAPEGVAMTDDTTAGTPERFAFDFDSRFAPLLSVLGIRPDTAGVLAGPGTLRVRFGPWVIETPLANVCGVETTGPYSPWRVIGVHVSLADRGLTFATNARKGLCVRFHEPIRGGEPLGLLRHPGLTVTVTDPAGLAGKLSRRL